MKPGGSKYFLSELSGEERSLNRQSTQAGPPYLSVLPLNVGVKIPGTKENRNQGECQHCTTHLSSIAAPETLTILCLHAWSRTRTRENSNLRALKHMNEGERCRSWALHQSWLRIPPTSKPAGEAKRAAAAKPEALASRTQGEAGREVETPHEGRHKPEALPPEDERELDAMSNRTRVTRA